ncbi:hypothetical protein [Prochlorococcus marinus]|uniref:hypothetical protein n=1 Tax=Prochlorococcus marinus TaxID=1219 RepID=UPI0022B56AB2|nr:hypothetical protein [Prochlorococcus marinus]
MTTLLDRTIKVDYLQIKHLFNSSLQNKGNLSRLLNLMLLKNWLARLEGYMNNYSAKRQPYCLAALEKEVLISILIIHPNNRRGSCWAISIPLVIQEPIFNSLTDIKKALLKATLEIKAQELENIILKYPIKSNEDISIARELGFQPLKVYRTWSDKLDIFKDNLGSKSNNYTNSLKWESLNKINSERVWKLKISGESLHYREIINSQPIDYLNRFNKLTGILISSNGFYKNAIAGIIQKEYPLEKTTYQIVRDLAWDSRLQSELPKILNKIYLYNNEILIETNSKDETLNNLLVNIGLIEKEEKLLLGKSNLIRKSKKSYRLQKDSWESVLGNIQSQTPPLPSPTLDQR